MAQRKKVRQIFTHYLHSRQQSVYVAPKNAPADFIRRRMLSACSGFVNNKSRNRTTAEWSFIQSFHIVTLKSVSLITKGESMLWWDKSLLALVSSLGLLMKRNRENNTTSSFKSSEWYQCFCCSANHKQVKREVEQSTCFPFSGFKAMISGVSTPPPRSDWAILCASVDFLWMFHRWQDWSDEQWLPTAVRSLSKRGRLETWD